MDVVVLDLRHTPAFTDFFILCSGSEPAAGQGDRRRDRRGDARGEDPAGARRGLRPRRVGADGLLHRSSCTCSRRRRAQFYSLERLWGDAERIEITDRTSGRRRPGVDASRTGRRSSDALRRSRGRLPMVFWPSSWRRRAPHAITALPEPTRGPVCPACWNGIVRFTPPLCNQCGDPLPSWRVISLAAALCPRCRRRPALVSTVRAIGAYDGSLRAIVHALKYDGRRSLAPAARDADAVDRRRPC